MNTPPPATSCAESPGRAVLYVTGEMDPREREAFERHLDRCPVCRARVSRQRALDARLERLPVYAAPAAPPSEWLDRSEWPDRRATGRRLRRVSIVTLPLVAAAAALILALYPFGRERSELVAAALRAEADVSGRIVGAGESAEARVVDIPWLGFVTCSDHIVPETDGVYVCAMAVDGPLGEAGVAPGAVVRGIAGTRVRDRREMYERLARLRIGDTVRVTVVPPGTRAEEDVDVRLVRMELGADHPFDMRWSPALREHTFGTSDATPGGGSSGTREGRREEAARDGAGGRGGSSGSEVLVPVTNDVASVLGVDGGLRVTRIPTEAELMESLLAAAPGLFGEGGLEPGDVIVGLAGRPIRTRRDFFLALEAAQHAPYTVRLLDRLAGGATEIRVDPSRHAADRVVDGDPAPNAEERASVPRELLEHAAAFRRAERALADVWPGFFPPGSPFVMVDASGGVLLVREDVPPPPYRPVPGEELPPELRGVAWTTPGYPDGLGPNRFVLDYVVGGDTLPALPLRGRSTFGQRSFYIHEAFHGYQDRAQWRWLAGERRVRMGEHLVDPVVVDEEFRRAALREREILLDAVRETEEVPLRSLLSRYLEGRRERLRSAAAVVASLPEEGGLGADPEAVERSFERREGTATFVECMGAAAVTAGAGEPEVRECIEYELGRPLDEYPGVPEADARWMRYRLYGTGGALALLVERLGVEGWRERVAQGEALDRLLAEALLAPAGRSRAPGSGSDPRRHSTGSPSPYASSHSSKVMSSGFSSRLAYTGRAAQ